MRHTVTAQAEQPVWIDGGKGPILGIVTTAPDAIGNVVVCAGGWHGGSTNANRMVVRLARRLAAGGRTVVRFDWHGSGESPGHVRFFRLDEPEVGNALGATALARRHADLPTALVGVCIGTRAALAIAADIPNLHGLVLVSFPLPTARAKTKRAGRIGAGAALREAVRPAAVRGWFQPATRRVYVKFVRLKWQAVTRKLRPRRTAADAEVQRRTAASVTDLDVLVSQIAALVDRQVPVLFLFGDQDAAYEQFVAAQDGVLGDVLRRGAGNVTVDVVAGDLSGYSSLDSQTAFLDIVTGWLERPVPQS